jgi:MoxR-like ATPase
VDEAPGLTRAVEAFERQLDLEQRAEADEADGAAGKLAVARAISPGVDESEGGMLRLMSQALEAQRRKRYSPVHIAARVAQVDEVLAGARLRCQAAADAHQQLAAQLVGRLWCPPSQVQAWLAVLLANHHTLAALLARAEAARTGFASLPVDEQAPANAPNPLCIP